MGLTPEEDKKWDYILALDDELLRGGALVSEWSAFLTRDADIAYCAGANLASIFCALAAVDAHLRYDLQLPLSDRTSLRNLIDRGSYDWSGVEEELHSLRRLRNRWIHVRDPADDSHLSDESAVYHELEQHARRALRAMRQAIYSNPML